jgi:hypothetical protein
LPVSPTQISHQTEPRAVYARFLSAANNDLYDHPDFAEAMREALAAIEATSVEPIGRPDQVRVINTKAGRLQSG